MEPQHQTQHHLRECHHHHHQAAPCSQRDYIHISADVQQRVSVFARVRRTDKTPTRHDVHAGAHQPAMWSERVFSSAHWTIYQLRNNQRKIMRVRALTCSRYACKRIECTRRARTSMYIELSERGKVRVCLRVHVRCGAIASIRIVFHVYRVLCIR